ncbi:MAG: CHAT domain-containing protein [Pirellulales bacterium]|nr:CHAT domain-containing protein [Pirellulales bacterium]
MFTRFRRFRNAAPLAPVALLVVALVGLCCCHTAPAQVLGDRSYPQITYEAVFPAYYDGDYAAALDAFRREGSRGIKMPTRWIDSICYHTMVGECYYQLGQMDQALEQYESALKLYLSFPDWLLQVQFPPGINPQTTLKTVPWGKSARKARPGAFPDTVQIFQGQVDQSQVLRQGGVVKMPLLLGLHANEIVRCTILAMRRYRELGGPTCAQQQVTRDLIATLARRPVQPNHWTETWADVMLGVAYLAGGKDTQAKPVLERGLIALGEYDHPFTAVALFELGRMAMSEANYEVADNYFREATYAAVQFGDPGLFEEIVRWGTTNHLVANRDGLWPVLESARGWSRQQNQRALAASVALCIAESLAAQRQAAPCQQTLADVRNLISPERSLQNSRLGARFNYLSAVNAFQQQQVSAGEQSLAAAMTFQSKGSLWNFHLRLVDRLYGSGNIAPRNAVEYYAQLLRDPSALDWSQQPLEAITFALTPHASSYGNWFRAALERKAHEVALEVADLERRERFFTALPFGGRLLAIRWLLETPSDRLDQQATLDRQALLSRFPDYEALAKQVEQLRGQLGQLPLVPDDDEEQHKLVAGLKELESISARQEVLLREMSLSREASKITFPARHTAEEIESKLPEKTVLLDFYFSGKSYYVFAYTDGKYANWQIAQAAGVHKQLVKVLHDLGQVDANRPLDREALASDAWKKSAAELLKMLTKGGGDNLFAAADEVVIVPDGALWYVPFEALPITDADGKLVPLLSKCRVRYAPFASACVPDGRGRRPSAATAIVAGRLYPRDEPEVAKNWAQQLAEDLPGVGILPMPLPAPSATYSSLFSRLLVFDDIQLPADDLLAWRPVQFDKQPQSGSLSSWIALPGGAPDEVLLPGFHSAAESGVKKGSTDVPGRELFLATCGLLASGTRTVLISRWRVGGQTSFDLMREFLRELPAGDAAKAWQRSVLLAMSTKIDPPSEPRVNAAGMKDPPTAEHPFFWAGYLLIDPGSGGASSDDTGGGVLKLKPKSGDGGENQEGAPAEPNDDSGEDRSSNAAADGSTNRPPN